HIHGECVTAPLRRRRPSALEAAGGLLRLPFARTPPSLRRPSARSPGYGQGRHSRIPAAADPPASRSARSTRSSGPSRPSCGSRIRFASSTRSSYPYLWVTARLPDVSAPASRVPLDDRPTHRIFASENVTIFCIERAILT